MGKRGPKPISGPVLRLHGSWRGNKSPIDLNVDHRRPRRPIWLKGEAKKCWERLMPSLFNAGLVTELNRETLALLCCSWADYVEAERMLEDTRKKGKGFRALLVKTAGGGVTENPLVYTRKRAFDQVFKAASCFGLTPADLAGVRAVKKPDADKGKKKFFKGA